MHTANTCVRLFAIKCTCEYNRLHRPFEFLSALVRRYNQCGCVDIRHWPIRYITVPGANQVIDAPICNLTDACANKAAGPFHSDPTLWYTFCPKCRPECGSVRFDTTLSSLPASTDPMKEEIKAFVESSGVQLPTNWKSNWPAEIQRNFVELTVQCESLHIEHYNQTPSISRTTLLSNIGGQTGLWIGISFLSLMELIEVACRLIRYQYQALRQRKHQERRPTNEEGTPFTG